MDQYTVPPSHMFLNGKTMLIYNYLVMFKPFYISGAVRPQTRTQLPLSLVTTSASIARTGGH
jgi:hypothetical protein